MEQQDKWWTPETVAVVTGGESCLLDFDRRRHCRTQRTPPLPARYTHNTTNNTHLTTQTTTPQKKHFV